MANNIITLAISDIHLHIWKQYNEDGRRTKATLEILEKIIKRSHIEQIPILLGGDLFHTPKGLNTETLLAFNTFMEAVRTYYHLARVFGITGNHDGSKDNSLWEAACRAYPDILFNLDNQEAYTNPGGVKVIGLPYRKRNVDLVKDIEKAGKLPGKKILLLHTELYGAPDPSGYEATPQNFSRKSYALFKDFDLVLAGHIHKHTQVKDNVYMIGAPNQQRKSDTGCDMGYLEIYEDFSIKFIPTNAPEFRFYKEGENHPDTNDYWVEVPKPKKVKKNSEKGFRANMDKTKMAKIYAQETGIKSKKRINTLINILNKTEE